MLGMGEGDESFQLSERGAAIDGLLGLGGGVRKAIGGTGDEEAGLEPGLAEGLLRRASQLAQEREAAGQTPVLLVPAPLRQLLSRFLRRSLPQLRVLSHNEIPDNRTVRIVATLGAQA